MAEFEGFYPSGDGKVRKYTIDQVTSAILSFISNGVHPFWGNTLEVVSNNDMTVTLKSGSLFHNGNFYKNDSDKIIPLTLADGVLSRIDNITVRFSDLERLNYGTKVDGDYSLSPIAKAPQRDSTIFEYVVARIDVDAGTTVITQANIKPTKLDTSICGYSASLLQQINTTDLYNQVEAALAEFKEVEMADFIAWFDSIKDILDENVAAHLLLLIEEAQENITELQDRVGTLETDVSEIKSKQFLKNNNCILLGDSMNTGQGWGYYFRQQSGAVCAILGEGSSGYTRPGSQGNTFVEQLTTHLNTLTVKEKAEIDYLIVGGGANDYPPTTTESALRTAVTNFIDYANAQLPNAKIFIWANHTFASVSKDLLKNYNTIYDVAMELGVSVSTELMKLPMDHKLKWNSDGVHMTDIGYKEYAMNIINALQGYSVLKPIPFEASEVSATYTIAKQDCVICGGVVHLNMAMKVNTTSADITGTFFSNPYADDTKPLFFVGFMYRNSYSRLVSVSNNGSFRRTNDGLGFLQYDNLYIQCTYSLF